MTQNLQRFLDEDGKLKQLPAKYSMKLEAYAYLAEKFEKGKEYTEHDVNAILSSWHTFGDYFALRRGLVESGLMQRLPNGSKYWRSEKQEQGGPEQ